jgi:hypothetical protein
MAIMITATIFILSFTLFLVISNYLQVTDDQTNVEEKKPYSIRFGNIRGNKSSVTYKEFLFTFQPRVLSNVSSDFCEFSLIVTNLSNHTIVFGYGAADPRIYLSTKNGTVLDTSMHGVYPLWLRGLVLDPGESDSIELSNYFGSIFTEPIPPGSYWVATEVDVSFAWSDPSNTNRITGVNSIEIPRIYMEIN